MQHLVEGVRQAVASKSWYAALGLALALPDICRWVDSPNTKSGQRYKGWFSSHVEPKYMGGRSGRDVLLNGSGCYALRCAYLHQGDFDTSGQSASDVLKAFRFVVCTGRIYAHNNRRNHLLQLDVPTFCEDMCVAVEAWLPTVIDRAAASRLASLGTIEQLDGSTGFTV